MSATIEIPEGFVPVTGWHYRWLIQNRWGRPKPPGKHRRYNDRFRLVRKRERQNRRRNR